MSFVKKTSRPFFHASHPTLHSYINSSTHSSTLPPYPPVNSYARYTYLSIHPLIHPTIHIYTHKYMYVQIYLNAHFSKFKPRTILGLFHDRFCCLSFRLPEQHPVRILCEVSHETYGFITKEVNRFKLLRQYTVS